MYPASVPENASVARGWRNTTRYEGKSFNRQWWLGATAARESSATQATILEHTVSAAILSVPAFLTVALKSVKWLTSFPRQMRNLRPTFISSDSSKTCQDISHWSRYCALLRIASIKFLTQHRQFGEMFLPTVIRHDWPWNYWQNGE